MTVESASSFSYLRAGVSWLPGIGPVVSSYTVYEAIEAIKKQPANNQDDRLLTLANYSIHGAIGNVSSIAALVVLAVMAIFGGPIAWGLALVFLIGAATHIINALWIRDTLVKQMISDEWNRVSQPAVAIPDAIPPQSMLAPATASQFERGDMNPLDSSSRVVQDSAPKSAPGSPNPFNSLTHFQN